MTALAKGLRLNLFAGANIAVGLIALGTLRLIAQRRLLPQPAPATTQQGIAA
jgi:hypothetical protein